MAGAGPGADVRRGWRETTATLRRRLAGVPREGQSIALEQALELARQEPRTPTWPTSCASADPFAAVGIDLGATRAVRSTASEPRPRSWPIFQRAGLPLEQVAQLSSHQTESLREELLDRKAAGLCTPKQARALVACGIDPRALYYDEAKELLQEQRSQGGAERLAFAGREHSRSKRMTP